MSELEKIIDKLNTSNIKDAQGYLFLDFDGIQTKLTSTDVIGNALQDWFGEWLTTNSFLWKSGPHSQSWPDFILNDNSHLEIKTFNEKRSPGFDIANFDAFTRSLYEGHIERLHTKHLIFSYKVDSNNSFNITGFWIKECWEITGPSHKNITELQIKQKVPSNIRPKNWRSKKVLTYSNVKDFVIALSKVVNKYYPDRYPNNEWLKKVQTDYKSFYGRNL